MLIDARLLPRGQTLDSDVCIVGAGAAGITLARELAGTSLHVCLLESGGLAFDAEAHALLRGENAGAPYHALDSCRLRFFGGTTNHWSGACWPLEALDLETRSEVPGSGWPFPRSHLDPWYERAQEVCQLGPFDYDPAHWEGAGAAQPFGSGAVVPKLMQMSPPTRFGIRYRDDVAKAANVVTCVDATVTGIEVEGSGRGVSGLTVSSLGGPSFRATARRYVLASGGIENARLLLLSAREASRALGNEHDQVGRCFMDHLIVPCGVWIPSRPGIDLSCFGTREVRGVRVRSALGLRPEWLRKEGVLNFSANVHSYRLEEADASRERVPGLPDALAEPVRSLLRDLEARVSGEEEAPPGERIYLESHAEQAPNPASRVTLGEERDALGLRRARLDWRLTELDQRSIRRTTERLADEVGRLGLGRVRVLLPDDDAEWSRFDGSLAWTGPRGAFHHLGTTRMAEDPRSGVVDANCRVHGSPNLFVAGSSVFPTSGCVNPTLTIVALALRLADQLKEELR